MAGSEWVDWYTPEVLAFKESQAKALRNDGYTVTVDVIERRQFKR